MVINPNLIKDKVSDCFRIVKYTKQVYIGASGNASTSMGSLNTPSGYTFVGVLTVDNGYGDQWSVTYARYSDSIYAYIKSYYAGGLTATLSCFAIFVKTDVYNEILTT